MEKCKVVYLIVNVGFSEEAVNIIRELGANGATIVNARGTGGDHGYFFGMPIEPEKKLIISVVTEDVATRIMNVMANRISNSTANGICYCVDVEKVAFINKQVATIKNED